MPLTPMTPLLALTAPATSFTPSTTAVGGNVYLTALVGQIGRAHV
mgnify:CR=1 FL=1